MSTFDQLLADLARDHHRVQPKDALQWSANWFQQRLEEQRTRTRDALAHSRPASVSHDLLPADHFTDTPAGGAPPSVSPFSTTLSPLRRSLHEPPSPFGTLDVPGNALLAPDAGARTQRGSVAAGGGGAPLFHINGEEISPTSPVTAISPFAGFDNPSPFGQPVVADPLAPAPNPFNFDSAPFAPGAQSPGDYLHPQSSMIYARRTSVSAESIDPDGAPEEQLPVFPKTEEQLMRIRASISTSLLFRDLDEEQERGVVNAMQEKRVGKDEVVILQGDVGEYFYVVETGLLHCYIRPDPLPPSWLADEPKTPEAAAATAKFIQPGHHPKFGKRVAECKPGNSFGELALMYGHPRAATVLALEASTLWSLDRITFRTIILKAAHRRRTMYEQFLHSVPLLRSLEAGERSKIADALVSRVYEDGEAVVRQGEMGDTFFFVEDGDAVVTKSETDHGPAVEVGRLEKGDYFGELSLLRLAPRAATVSAVARPSPSSASKLKVAGLDAQAFTRLLGPLREIMERNAGAYGPGYSFTP